LHDFNVWWQISKAIFAGVAGLQSQGNDYISRVGPTTTSKKRKKLLMLRITPHERYKIANKTYKIANKTYKNAYKTYKIAFETYKISCIAQNCRHTKPCTVWILSCNHFSWNCFSKVLVATGDNHSGVAKMLGVLVQSFRGGPLEHPFDFKRFDILLVTTYIRTDNQIGQMSNLII